MNRSKVILVLSIALLILSIAKLAVSRHLAASMSELVLPFIMVAIILEQAAPKGESPSGRVFAVLRTCSFAVGVALFVCGGWLNL